MARDGIEGSLLLEHGSGSRSERLTGTDAALLYYLLERSAGNARLLTVMRHSRRSKSPSNHSAMACLEMSPRSQRDKSRFAVFSSEIRSIAGLLGERATLAVTPDRCTAVREIISSVQSERHASLSPSIMSPSS